MSTLKLGLVGAGFVARFHCRALKQVRGVEVAGITSRTSASAEALASMVRNSGLGEGVVYTSVTEMADHVDAIAIYAPNFARVEIVEEIVEAVKRGAALKGVICEKPLARNVREARRMVELVEEVGLRTAYFENQIFMKPVRAQLAQLEPLQRTMGPLALARSAEEHGGPHEAWFWDPVRQGGGTLCDMGCHSLAAGWYVLTPAGKPPTFLEPIAVSAECALLKCLSEKRNRRIPMRRYKRHRDAACTVFRIGSKWGLPRWREVLLKRFGVDYARTPAEDFATGMVTYRNPETGQLVKAQFTNSWMFEKQGLRLLMDGMGPGYAFEINSLNSALQVFIADVAAEAVADAELALEKATASRGLLAVQYNEPDLYGYTDENEDARDAFLAGRDGFLPWSYGLEITRLVMAAYMSAERQRTVDLTDPAVQQELETYVPLIQQGRGAEVLYAAGKK